ncbi:hypothetical protein ABZ614_13450 [Streptomyces sp. NPDC013178]|uniref:hypothetical protein n=1 Tax=unclassified Streptomyces TaxID=2593676 RepID=UPI0033CF72DE
MELLKQSPTGKGPARFSGDVRHGAGPDQFMIHLALWESPGPDGGPENTWLEHVTDAEYDGPRVSTRTSR